jgi:Xaa-Pro dipeptidase
MTEGSAVPAWDERRLKAERLERLQEEMRRLGIGAIYLSDGANIRYVMNQRIPGGKAFVLAAGEPIAFVRARDAGYVGQSHENMLPTLYMNTWEPANDGKMDAFAATIARVMAERGLAGERLGVDPLDASAFHALLRASLTVVDARPAIEYAKSVKTQDEVAIYRWIGARYASTLQTFRDAIRPGATERELAALVSSTWFDNGGEAITQLNVCSGEHMNPWRRWPTDRKLVAGELVGIDLHAHGPVGLLGDVSRTFAVSTANDEQQGLYRRVFDYLDELASGFRAGRVIGDVIANLPPVPEVFRTPLYNYEVAHPIGMTPSGYPMLKLKDCPLDDVLKPNQVFAVESYFGEKGSPLAVKAEHMVVVHEKGPEILDEGVVRDDRLRG